ncbi:putative ankyrin repeat protein [Phytophthora citrophthora]|uniref:Ankyrin repeat protein n=1 Tax=Phytophthora citrophthora TaxID=4793 RepID=A0AAD9G106_9STRA|nr:putative ankyrin repeat protein [Phytophthora citrophthora]
MSDGLSPPRKRARLRAEEETTAHQAPSAAPEAFAAIHMPPDPQEEPDHRTHLAMSSFLLMARGRLDAQTPAETLESAEALSAAGALEALSSSVVLPPVVDEPMPMAVAVAAEESTTDDEELQQLSMVKLEPSGTMLCEGSVAVELVYEDVENFLFNMAKEQKTQQLHKGMRTVKKARNAEILMPRLLNAEDETGLTLLMIGVRSNDRVFCNMLLDAGADVNFKTEKRTYALLLAAQKGWEDMTRFLLERGANEKSKNMALIPAAHFGHLPVVKMLLETGGDQNFANKKGTTPLMRAAQEGRDAVVRFLIEKGADTCASNNEGMTALMLAAQRGHANIATTLMKSGSNVNKQTRQGSTALLLAAKRGHTAAVEALMTAGADIFLKDDRDKTAAETAQRRGHVDLFLKISVQNQLRLMREDLRRQRCYTLMRLSTLYVLSRAELMPAFKNQKRQQYNALMDRTLRLPKPLLQNIALFLPLCRMWDRQLRYLIYEAAPQPNRVVQQGIRILDEVLLSVSLELRPSLHYIKQECGGPLHMTGQLGLLRDSSEYRGLFTIECRTPMPPRMLHQLRRMADIQGALSTYAAGSAIQFGVEVAQDVVSLLTDLLGWDSSRRQAELLD